MTRPGWLVHAEHEARDEGLRRMEDERPDRDQPTSDGETCARGCQEHAACRAIARDWRRLGWIS